MSSTTGSAFPPRRALMTAAAGALVVAPFVKRTWAQGAASAPVASDKTADALFQLNLGEVTTGETADGAIVARVTAIEAADPATAADAMKEAGARETQALASDLRQSFLAALRTELPVERKDEIWQRAVENAN